MLLKIVFGESSYTTESMCNLINNSINNRSSNSNRHVAFLILFRASSPCTSVPLIKRLHEAEMQIGFHSALTHIWLVNLTVSEKTEDAEWVLWRQINLSHSDTFSPLLLFSTISTRKKNPHELTWRLYTFTWTHIGETQQGIVIGGLVWGWSQVAEGSRL